MCDKMITVIFITCISVCLGGGRNPCGCIIQQVLHKRAKCQDVIICVILSEKVSSQYMC